MIPITTLENQKVAVFGLGISGLATVQALFAGGAEIACWDDGDAGRQKALDIGLPLVDLTQSDWSDYSALILAPGVPLTHPTPHWTVRKAQEHGVEVIGDTELFFREHHKQSSKSKIIGITGTNGKSTTTALVTHILSVNDYSVQMGGNIGKAILELEPFRDEMIYVIEFSSYQIDLTPSLKPDAAALLNITPDHLDRHGTLENYAVVKARIFARLEEGDTAVIGVDDPHCQKIAKELSRDFSVQHISVNECVETGVVAREGHLLIMENGHTSCEFSLTDIPSLRGPHNWQNAAAAYALLASVGVSQDEIKKGMHSFPGLEHRMQQIATRGSVRFVNDSKASNADAVEKALLSFDNIYWIAGGLAKEGGIESLVPYFSKIQKAYLIGEAAEDFAAVLAEHNVPYVMCGNLQKAVTLSADNASQSKQDEPVVLLSPACASFDQFPNFMKRGEAFCNLVYDLPGVEK